MGLVATESEICNITVTTYIKIKLYSSKDITLQKQIIRILTIKELINILEILYKNKKNKHINKKNKLEPTTLIGGKGEGVYFYYWQHFFVRKAVFQV